METELTVKADDGRSFSFLTSDYSDEKVTYLCHAYALTVYSSQGVTVDGSTFVYGDAGMDQSNSYVAMSRNKGFSYVYLTVGNINELSFSRGGLSSDLAMNEVVHLDLIP